MNIKGRGSRETLVSLGKYLNSVFLLFLKESAIEDGRIRQGF